MFGPNSNLVYRVNINYSHRDKYFIEIIKRLKETFYKTFNLNNYDVLFIPGSGTTGVESIFYSLISKIKVIGNNGNFFDRWCSLAERYNQNKQSGYEELYCQLETSQSKIFHKRGCIVDAVSSFPYAEIPEDTKILVTASNKILGSMPGCAIVLVKNDYWNNLISDDIISTLNLSRYNFYSLFNQTPTTPPTQIYEHLLGILKNYDVDKIREKINRNSRIIVQSIGEENFIGDIECPVLTVPKNNIPLEIAEKYELYHVNTADSTYQIFTYSEQDYKYDQFAKEFKRK